MFCRNVDSFPFRQISGTPYRSYFRKGPAKNLFDIDGSNSLAYILQAIMIIMSGRVVTRYLESATEDMLRNKQKDIR
jgi:hypothetical protein